MSKSSTSNSSSNTNSSSSLTSNTVATPTNPDWVTNSVSGLQDKINGLLNSDPQALVAGPSSLQTQAFNTAQTLGGWQPSSATAANAATGLLTSGVDPALASVTNAGVTNAGVSSAAPTLATSGTLPGTDLSAYFNPYQDAVIKTSLSDADQNAAMVRAQQAAANARDQKFSGSGTALTSALTEDQLARARASLDANLRAQGYNTATANATNDLNRSAQTSALNAELGTNASEFNAGQANDTSRFNAGNANTASLANAGAANNTSQFNAGQTNSLGEQDLQRRLAAAGLLGDLSNSTAANDRADLGLLGSLGDDQRSIAQNQAAAPAGLLALISQLNAGQPYGLFHGGTTNTNGTETGTSSTNGTSTTTTDDPFGTLGSLASGGGSLLSGLGSIGFRISDKDLKTDIETVGKDKMGRRVVSYRFKGEPKGTNRIGYLAQEVEKTDPHAVATGPGGFKMINYGLLSQAA